MRLRKGKGSVRSAALAGAGPAGAGLQVRAAWVAFAILLSLMLVACGGSGKSSQSGTGGSGAHGGSGESAEVGGAGAGSAGAADTTTGAAFQAPPEVDAPAFDAQVAVTQNDGSIDTTSVAQGVVIASGVSASRLKFIVTCGNMTYNYDLPGTGEPITCPLNMGDGTYAFSIMRNVGGNDYVETTSASADVQLESEFVPFLQPNVFCDYNNDSACVAKARELTADAQNEGDAVRAICTYIIDNIAYDTTKAEQLSGTAGYVPNPDETFESGTGICFDYASLGAAMLRSMGIPTKIITGYVSPEDLYHAWIMVYIDGSWSSAKFSVNPQSWSRVDLTFAADSASVGLVGDGKTYTERYVY